MKLTKITEPCVTSPAPTRPAFMQTCPPGKILLLESSWRPVELQTLRLSESSGCIGAVAADSSIRCFGLYCSAWVFNHWLSLQVILPLEFRLHWCSSCRRFVQVLRTAWQFVGFQPLHCRCRLFCRRDLLVCPLLLGWLQTLRLSEASGCSGLLLCRLLCHCALLHGSWRHG